MTCRICGGEVDDPFWDDLCPECEHEMHHDAGNFHPECGWCASEAERYSQEYDDVEPAWVAES